MKLIESDFGRYLYKEISKVYITIFGDFPATIPEDVKEELENELQSTN